MPSEIRLLDSYMSASGVMISISNLKLDLCKFLSQTVNSKVSRCVLTRIWINVRILGHSGAYFKYVDIRFIFRWSFTPDDKCPICEICQLEPYLILGVSSTACTKFSNVSDPHSIPALLEILRSTEIVITC